MKKTPENRFIAYSRISELRVEPLELFLDKMQEKVNSPLPQGRGVRGEGLKKIPNKLENKREVLEKAYNYVKRVYEDLFEKFIFELEKTLSLSPLKKGIIGELIISEFELKIFK